MEHNYDKVWRDKYYNNESTKSCELYSNSPRAAGSLNNVGNYIHDSTPVQMHVSNMFRQNKYMNDYQIVSWNKPKCRQMVIKWMT